MSSFRGLGVYLILSKTTICFREELALIENRILEKEMAAKRRAERLAKNIAVSPTSFFSVFIQPFDQYLRLGVHLHLTHSIMQEYGDSKRAQALWDVDSDDEEEDILEPNPKLSQGNNS